MFPNLYGQKQQPEQVGFCSHRLARITPWLENYVDDGKLPFGNVVVMRKGKVAYSHLYGFRDVEKQSAAIEDGLYRIYSMSKLITTVVAMSLFESGELMLDDPISMYIPRFLN